MAAPSSSLSHGPFCSLPSRGRGDSGRVLPPAGMLQRNGMACGTPHRRGPVELKSSLFSHCLRGEGVLPQRTRLKRRDSVVVRAATGNDGYWVTVVQSVGIAVLTAGSAVFAGLLFRYKMRQEAKNDVEKMMEECKENNRPLPTTMEEFEEFKVKFQESKQEGTRNRPIRKE